MMAMLTTMMTLLTKLRWCEGAGVAADPDAVVGAPAGAPITQKLTLAPDVCQVLDCGGEFFMENLPVRTHLIIEMILVDRPCAMGVRNPFSR